MCSESFKRTCTDIEFEVLRDLADGSEVGGVEEVFFHGLRGNLSQLILHGFTHTYSIHGDTCNMQDTHQTLCQKYVLAINYYYYIILPLFYKC